MTAPAEADPFATAARRATVLAGWQAAPSRFREDANAEEDHARGSYRDRLVVELAQNAADAAARAAVPGRLLLRLRGHELIAANTGHALDAAGVEGLATLRASAKRGEATTVGRFGVGFAAVLAVTDEPRIISRDGGVAFSSSRTRDAVAALPALHDELARRDSHVPVLRLPFEVPREEVTAVLDEVAGDAGAYDTVVVLPLRDARAVALARDALGVIDDALLLALPSLTEVVIDDGTAPRILRAVRDGRDVVVTDGSDERRWSTLNASGVLAEDLLRERPVEERARPGWSITWAVRVDEAGPRPDLVAESRVPLVLHAPTPTEEAVTVPALLVATFPLEPGRRHVVTGPLTDTLVQHAAHAYADLVAGLAASSGASVLRLVPGGLPSGPLDAALREAIVAALSARAFVAAADGGPALTPPDAARLEPGSAAVVSVLSSVRDGLTEAMWRAPVLEVLGSPVLALADALDELASLQRPVVWWHALYEALDDANLPPAVLEGLPVPLGDGRVVRGPRGVVCADDPQLVALLGLLPGLRVAAPGAGHPLLLRLGAVLDDPVALLASPAVAAAVAGSLDLDDPGPVCDAVLELVARSGASQLEGLGALALPSGTGEWAPAADLVLPGSLLAEALAAGPDDLVATSVVEGHGPDVLTAVGVAAEFPVEIVVDEPLEPAHWDELVPDGGAWAQAVDDQLGRPALPPLVGEARLVHRLDAVVDDGWPVAARLLREGAARQAVVSPVSVVVEGRRVDVVSPAAWWLRDAPLIDGRPPVELRMPDADPALAALYEPVAAHWLDDAEWLRAVGVRASVDDLVRDVDDVADLLDRLAEDHRSVSADALLALYRALATLPEERWPEPPQRVRVLAAGTADGETVVRNASEVVVALSPLHVPVLGGNVLPGTGVLAAVLDLEPSSALVDAPASGDGVRQDVPRAVAAWCAPHEVTWVEHDDLVVEGVSVDGWVDPDGTVHAATTHGLARALAWRAGRWSDRHDIAELLADPARADQVRVDRAFD